ncbi:hypothetical protein [Halorubrum sp. HHNYT27]|uniref:hypothetical protein n=1 Tax=Halorubrum sp. HHNYT27 TaxID=3402275 RepID=UPI003EBAE6C5
MDFPGYPDSRPAFFDAFQNVLDFGTKPETAPELKAPFVEPLLTWWTANGCDGLPWRESDQTSF